MKTTTLKTKIVKIGNSQGIRIPKPILEQIGVSNELEMEVKEGEIVLRLPKSSREGWAERFQEMAVKGDDKLLDDESFVLTDWEETEWEWD